MGDRANVIIKQGNGDPPVVLYSHWGGTELRDRLVDTAVEAARSRAGDPHYFTALMVAPIANAGLLSGIGTSLDDNNGPIMLVDAIDGRREPDLSESEARALLSRWRTVE